MWKVKSVQVSNERGALNTSIGVISRLETANGWSFELGDGYVLASKDDTRLRFPLELVVVEEQLEAEPAKSKRVREVA